MSFKSHISFNKIPDVMRASERGRARALEAAAIDIHGQSLELVPVITGNLKGSLSWTVANKIGGKDSGGEKAIDANAYIKTQPDEDTAYIGTNVDYAPSVEFGSGTRRAKSYLRSAMDIKEGDAKKIMAEYIRRDIEGAAR